MVIPSLPPFLAPLLPRHSIQIHPVIHPISRPAISLTNLTLSTSSQSHPMLHCPPQESPPLTRLSAAGLYGTELLHVSWGRLLSSHCRERGLPSHGLRGLKLCGNDRVPAGRCSFHAWGELLAPTAIDEMEPLGCTYPCCFNCFPPCELCSQQVSIVGAMSAFVTTAMPGFHSPKHNPAKAIFLKRRSPAPLPIELRKVGSVGGSEVLHIMLLWNGSNGTKTSMRLSPLVINAAGAQVAEALESTFAVTLASGKEGREPLSSGREMEEASAELLTSPACAAARLHELRGRRQHHAKITKCEPNRHT